MNNSRNVVKTGNDQVTTVNGMNRLINSKLAVLTGGLSPIALYLAFTDWLTHLAISHDERLELIKEAGHLILEFNSRMLQSMLSDENSSNIGPCGDKRFSSPAWSSWPFNMFSQYFLMEQCWWEKATSMVPGVSRHHEEVVKFMTRQLLDVTSPANFIFTNPEVLQHTARERGVNLIHGFFNLIDRVNRIQNKLPPPGSENFEVGKQVAATPGKVVYRNQLIELIQYEPTTKKVYENPILIVSAWIMKYYVLDLSPHNSLIKYLVDKGHTVFAVSWINPGSEHRDFGIGDYLKMGIMEPLDAINAIVPNHKIHGVGYCLGGTLLSIAAAAMGGKKDERFASITTFTTQVDFTEPGELSIFIDESQIAFLEDIMWEKGYLDSKHMNGAFQLLNSTDLLWSRIIKNYMMGQTQELNDLSAWNSDGTRLPYKMHSEYLRQLFLNNDLASGRYHVNNEPIALTNIHCPIFAVATDRDHIAPWNSVYKIHLLTDTEVTFVLTSGGHNVGIVNPPGVAGRSFQALMRPQGANYVDPAKWQADAPHYEGSWWSYWSEWLQGRSGKLINPPAMGASQAGYAPIMDAPGSYVRMR
jgi:polyhydroxyalkanoate synthase